MVIGVPLNTRNDGVLYSLSAETPMVFSETLREIGDMEMLQTMNPLELWVTNPYSQLLVFLSNALRKVVHCTKHMYTSLWDKMASWKLASNNWTTHKKTTSSIFPPFLFLYDYGHVILHVSKEYLIIEEKGKKKMDNFYETDSNNFLSRVEGTQCLMWCINNNYLT